MQKVFPAKSIVRCNPSNCFTKEDCRLYKQHLQKPDAHCHDVSEIELSKNPDAVDCQYFTPLKGVESISV